MCRWVGDYWVDELVVGGVTKPPLITQAEWWKFCQDKQGFARALLTEWSKTFDTLNHERLTAKVYAYGFFIEVLEVFLSYLQDRWQRIKTNTTFSLRLIYSKEFLKDQSLIPHFLICTFIMIYVFALKVIDICNFAHGTSS